MRKSFLSNYFSMGYIKSNIFFIIYNIIKRIKFSKYPSVLQLPVTNKCNLNCVMCNVPNIDTKNEFSVNGLENILDDKIFSKIKAVGVNGGEPFILKNIEEYVRVILKLKKLKSIHIISNGYFTNIIQEKIKIISEMCTSRNIKLNISISLDGVGKVHDSIRGNSNSFINAIRTINVLRNSNYCDSINVTCTVVKQNVEYLSELQVFCDENDIDIKYRLGIENNRIDNMSMFQEYHIESDLRMLMLTREFFYKKIFESKIIRDMYKYWSIFEFLVRDEKVRHLGCIWKKDGITLSPKGEVFYCATKSKKIGELPKEKGIDIYFDKNNIKYRKNLIEKECDNCIHDYTGPASFKSIIQFYSFLITKRTWVISMRRLLK